MGLRYSPRMGCEQSTDALLESMRGGFDVGVGPDGPPPIQRVSLIQRLIVWIRWR